MVDGQDRARPPILTIGYGSRSIEEFIAVLGRNAVQFLIDVRSSPHSKFKPEFSQAPLDRALRAAGIRYVFMGDTLGGRPTDPSCYMDGKVDYTKCREKPFFQAGLARLQTAWGQHLRVALMCSEGRLEECHRSKLIGASLADSGIETLHIDETGGLKTQDEVSRLLNGGQGSLFAGASDASLSRKRYPVPAGQPDMNKPKIVTIGVYGFTPEDFFQTLVDVGVDTFCDIRQRRGMRGPQYAFVNSARLQKKLAELGIRYLHIKALAPSQKNRDEQKEADEKAGVAKRERDALDEAFTESYRRERLSTFDFAGFAEQLGSQAKVVALFCVEREPGACHRSLVAEHLEQKLGFPVAHVRPCESSSSPRRE